MIIRHEPTENFSLKGFVTMLLEKASPSGLHVRDVILIFGSRSHAFLILFFALPFAQPLPMFGLSTPMGFMIAIVGVYMSLGKPLWLPKRFLDKHISYSLIESSCNVLIKLLNRSEKLIRPRHGWWFSQTFFRVINGIMVAIFALLLSLPLPIPFTNAFPAWFFVINAVAWLERDGMLLLGSYLVAITGLIFFFAIGGGVIEGIHMINAKLQTYF
jgi:hypothetical protein